MCLVCVHVSVCVHGVHMAWTCTHVMPWWVCGDQRCSLGFLLPSSPGFWGWHSCTRFAQASDPSFSVPSGLSTLLTLCKLSRQPASLLLTYTQRFRPSVGSSPSVLPLQSPVCASPLDLSLEPHNFQKAHQWLGVVAHSFNRSTLRQRQVDLWVFKVSQGK